MARSVCSGSSLWRFAGNGFDKSGAHNQAIGSNVPDSRGLSFLSRAADLALDTPFCFFSGEEIEDFLAGTCYSQELEALGLLPIAEFENDKLCCLDGEYPAFIVVQLGMGTLQPLRKYLLHRTTSVAGFIEYLQWRKPPAPSGEHS